MKTLPTLDAMYERMAPYGPEYGPSLSSHVPMVLEALDRLGRADLSEAYLSNWIPRLRRLSPDADAELVAYPERLSETTSVVRKLGPRGAVNALFPRYAPGLHGAAFHGLLRLAHAARAVRRDETPERLYELSQGLAYAITRSEAPFLNQVSNGHEAFERAIALVESSPHAHEKRVGPITLLAGRLGRGELLAKAVARLAIPEDPLAAVRSLRRASLVLYVDGLRHPSASFVLLHGVTSVDAAEALVPWLTEENAKALVRYMATALVALKVAYVPEIRATLSSVPRATELPASLVDAALRTMDDHAIKLAAACAEGARDVPDAPWAAALVV
jgi:hypothetical protein